MAPAVALPYGKSLQHLPPHLADRTRTLRPGPFPETADKRVLSEALEHPAGGFSLKDLPLSTGQVVCLIPDLTRRAAVASYLPVLLESALAAGLAPDRLEILIALGIHRAMTEPEIRNHVGSWVHDRFRVVNHDCDSEGGNVLVGTTRRGIPVRVNRKVAEADALIVTGSVTYHYFAGYGGGRKAILPGVCARSTCERHHKLVVQWRRGQIHGTVAAGRLDGNPVEEEMLEAAAMMPPTFALNLVTAPDGRIVGASTGEPGPAHAAACVLCDRFYRRLLPEASRLVIASAGGWPRDINFVQAHKGYLSACSAVAEDGVVILLARCGEGAGHPDFLSWFRRCRDDEAWLEELDRNYQINGQTAYSTWLRARRIRTVLVSEMKADDVQTMGMIPAGDLQEALAIAETELGGVPEPLVLPHAADMLVEASGGEENR